MGQNQRLVAVVKIESDEAHGRVLLVDRLPSGLEIDNPRLVEGGDVSNLEWLKDTLKPQHTEFRDDRFVAAFDLSADDLIELKQAGVSEQVMRTMIHPDAGVAYRYVPVRSPFPSYFYPPYSAIRGPYGYSYPRPVRHHRIHRPPAEQPAEGEGR